MMTRTFTFSGAVVVEHCLTCGVAFGLDQEHRRQLLRSHESYYCPNGHAQHYVGQSDVEKAQAEAKAARESAAWWEERAASHRKAAEQARRSAAANRGVVTRIKRRLGEGKCPCCKQRFVDLEKHMQGQHPDYLADA